jgi:hypothetical protein
MGIPMASSVWGIYINSSQPTWLTCLPYSMLHFDYITLILVVEKSFDEIIFHLSLFS